MDSVSIWAGVETPVVEIAIRLALASLCGAILGYEREITDQTAGLRTHMMIALAAAIFTLITFEIVQSVDDANRADPIRIIEAVTAGVAFLAAGAIIQSGPKTVKGLTTGAGMWTAGALGMACGGGFYAIAALGTLFAFVILATLRRLEKRVL